MGCEGRRDAMAKIILCPGQGCGEQIKNGTSLLAVKVDVIHIIMLLCQWDVHTGDTRQKMSVNSTKNLPLKKMS